MNVTTCDSNITMEIKWSHWFKYVLEFCTKVSLTSANVMVRSGYFVHRLKM